MRPRDGRTAARPVSSPPPPPAPPPVRAPLRCLASPCSEPTRKPPATQSPPSVRAHVLLHEQGHDRDLTNRAMTESLAPRPRVSQMLPAAARQVRTRALAWTTVGRAAMGAGARQMSSLEGTKTLQVRRRRGRGRACAAPAAGVRRRDLTAAHARTEPARGLCRRVARACALPLFRAARRRGGLLGGGGGVPPGGGFRGGAGTRWLCSLCVPGAVRAPCSRAPPL